MSTVTIQHFDMDGTLTGTEVLTLPTESVRREAIHTGLRRAIGHLRQIEAQAANRPNASNMQAANTQLQGLADAVADVAKMVRHIIILDVAPDLLADDVAAGDLDDVG